MIKLKVDETWDIIIKNYNLKEDENGFIVELDYELCSTEKEPAPVNDKNVERAISAFHDYMQKEMIKILDNLNA